MIKTVIENKILYFVWFISMVCIILNIMTSNILAIFAFVIFTIAAIFLDSNDTFCILFGLMPFANIFKLGPESMSLFTICEIIVVIIMLIKRKKINIYLLVTVFALMIYMIIFSLNQLNVLLIIKIVIGFLLIGLFLPYIREKDVKNIAYLLSISTLITLFASMNKNYFSYVESYLIDLNYYINSSGELTNIIRVSGFLGDPNYCAVLIVMCASLLLLLYYYEKVGKEFWPLFLVLIILGLFTYSKSYLITLLLLLFILVFFVLWKKNKIFAIVSIICLGTIILIAHSGKISVINMVVDRFDVKDMTTGRFKLNVQYLNYIFDNPSVMFFGKGIQSDRFFGVSNNVHNIYIELLYKMGIIGSFVYLTTLINCFFIMKKNLKFTIFKSINFVPCFFMLLMFFFLAGVTTYELPFYLMIVFISVCYDSILISKNAK